MMNIQEIVDELAVALDRSVVINDLDHRPIAASAQGDAIDAIRAATLLQRRTPPAARALVEQLKIAQARQPVQVDMSELQALDRLSIPIRDDGGPLGIMWLITGGLPPLTPAHYSAIDAAVLLVRDELSHQIPLEDSTARISVIARLLAVDGAIARRAFSDAVSNLWLERGSGTLVVAVALGSKVGAIERVAFGRQLDARRTQGIFYLGERGTTQLFIVRAAESAPVIEQIQNEAADRSLPLRAIGTARLDRYAEDIRTTVDHAVTAAHTVLQLPHLTGVADISELGTWLMLSSIAEDTAQIALFSPAAYALCVDGDAVQRSTIETYLDVRSQVKEACQLLHIHRTTLYYRLENMPPIVKLALDDGVARSTLHLCLKLIRFWETKAQVSRQEHSSLRE
ncbi:PucR family transcriptional regulator [Subtercola endophyticus]|uniref:PucR family transcriptional regulator n=1 Tax=Subtercola endophyticus TaxID=2895559 RepID=UPI001E55BED6|nr:PucR family transcriptional regulator [Subtercola endophyticus]UFS60412.1 helix-turn-helix domain-containing protein [Subtercola endophyticus]